MKKSVPTLSLFSGAGGLDIGFHRAGFEIVACVELEESYCKTLRANRGIGKEFDESLEVYCQDVREFDPSPFKSRGIECIVGGPPCQTFSAAGRRSGGVIGTRDQRGLLFERYCEILDVIQPRAFVFENVYGLPGANGGGPWKEIVRAFGALGYELHAEVVDTADYGVPQHRERLIMVGVKGGTFTFPMPTHGPESSDNTPLVSAGTAIKDLQDKSEPYHDGLGGLYGHLLPKVPEGLNYAYFTAEMGHPEPQFAWRSKFHDLLYKVDRNNPCRTIKAQPGKFTGPFHWKNRHFTMPELKRLQTFPDSYELVGAQSRIIEQIGNSVPPLLAEVIGVSLREQIFEDLNSQTYQPRPSGFKSTFRQRQRERSKHFKQVARERIESEYGALGVSHTSSDENGSHEKEQYIICCRGLFERTRQKPGSLPEDPRRRSFDISVAREQNAVKIKFAALPKIEGAIASVISIAGLTKYLGSIETVCVEAYVSTLFDVFHMWKTIEDALVERSRFYSLIDIYGHYANRGDTVEVTTDIRLEEQSAVTRVLNTLMNSQRCGDFISTSSLKELATLTDNELSESVKSLRLARFDVRTIETHPIIPTDSVLCTYPFPLLSQRALVASRAQLIAEDSEQYSLAIGA